jgi:hypothetical protein
MSAISLYECIFCNKTFHNNQSLSIHKLWHSGGFKSENTLGERNGVWQGNEVSYFALHDYIKYNKPKPMTCDCCNQKKKLDLANISQNYKRDLDDWGWLCRKCHMIKDGRLNKNNKVLQSINFQGSKTHCPQGHEYNNKNTYYDKQHHRHCKKCRYISVRKYILKKRKGRA